MKRPNFLILGVSRSGTTSLYSYLNQHRDVFMSTPKEPLFFEAEYEQGLQFYWDHYFTDWNGQQTVGEARALNLLIPYVPPRIKESLPEARLIAILRNPVDRAFSHWWARRCRGFENLSFAAALQENLARIEAGVTLEGEEGERLWRANIPPDRSHVKLRVYLDAGYYATQIGRYLQLFPSSQIKILLFDDLCQQPQAVFQGLLDFLGLDVNVPLQNVVQNIGFTKVERRLLKVNRALKLSKVMPERLGWLLRMLLNKFSSRPRMDHATKRRLTDHFYPHNRKLERIIDRDLSHWDKVGS